VCLPAALLLVTLGAGDDAERFAPFLCPLQMTLQHAALKVMTESATVNMTLVLAS